MSSLNLSLNICIVFIHRSISDIFQIQIYQKMAYSIEQGTWYNKAQPGALRASKKID